VPAGTDQGTARLSEHLGRQVRHVLDCDVRRVGHDQVERAVRAGEQITSAKLDPSVHCEPSLVRLGNRERVGRGVGRDDSRVGPLVRDCECDRARADTDVEHAGMVEPFEELEAALDDDFRLGSGDQHARVDGQREAPEPPLSEHVRKRLPLSPPLDKRSELNELFRV
jgi:hypothetical protein